jgi:two-component system nitrate/nitrite response regulator NarL
MEESMNDKRLAWRGHNQTGDVQLERQRTVLICGDDGLRDRLREAIEEAADVAVLDVATGHQGLTAVRTYRPGTVFVDNELPGLNGWAVAAAISRNILGVRVLLTAPVIDFDHLAACTACGATPLERDADGPAIRRALDAEPGDQARFHPWPIPQLDAVYADGYVPGRGKSVEMTLTDWQAAVLDCLLMGIPTRDLPAALETTSYRARKYADEMLLALGVGRKVSAVAAAFERGWTASGRSVGSVTVERPANAAPFRRGRARREPLVTFGDAWEAAV